MPLNNARPIHDAPIFMPSLTLTLYEPGDLLWSDTGVAKPASSQVDQLSLGANQVEFATNFVGICGTQKLAAKAGTGVVQVNSDLEYQFTCASATFLVGDLLGITEVGGTAVSDTIVVKVTDPSAAIAVVSEAGASVTKVWARPLSRFGRSFYGPGDLATGGQMIAQTIDMADAPVVLTKDAAEDAGTYMSGNFLLVDANGNVEILTLPAESDMPNALVIIKNTGGETITVNNDAGGLVVSLLTAEVSILHCDGTTWNQVAMAFT